jgi:cytochrome c553
MMARTSSGDGHMRESASAPAKSTYQLGALLALLCSVCYPAPVDGAGEPPSWAYPVPPADLAAPADDGQPVQVPGSSVAYSVTQLRDIFAAADWHPDDHPPLPPVVAHGRPPAVYACGYCHRADGSGGPENARLAGLPYGYILQQLADLRSGARRTALPQRRPQAAMMALAKALAPDDARAAAAYFSTLRPRRNIRVVESRTVPKTITPGWFLAPAPGGAVEPIGERIIEVPENVTDFEHRDARAQFIAYVPPGSLARGAAIVAGAARGKTPACAGCHGTGLHGQGNVPGLAGRSPSYVVRQLYDMASGVRAGQAVQVMRGLVGRLDGNDMIDVAAYIASLEP